MSETPTPEAQVAPEKVPPTPEESLARIKTAVDQLVDSHPRMSRVLRDLGTAERVEFLCWSLRLAYKLNLPVLPQTQPTTNPETDDDDVETVADSEVCHVDDTEH